MTPILLDIAPIWGIRDPFSMASHLLGALISLGAAFALVREGRRRGLSGTAAGRLAAYGASMVAVFTASTLFHFSAEEVVLLKKLDHAAIFLVMGGTCTAIYGALNAPWVRPLIGTMWLLIGVGLVVKWVVWPMPLWLTALTYSAVGALAGSGLFVFARETPRQALRLLVHGILLFLIGAVVFAAEQPILWSGVVEGHELFHVLVLAATGLHFQFIYRHCTTPGGLCFETERAQAGTEKAPGVLAEPAS